MYKKVQKKNNKKIKLDENKRKRYNWNYENVNFANYYLRTL